MKVEHLLRSEPEMLLHLPPEHTTVVSHREAASTTNKLTAQIASKPVGSLHMPCQRSPARMETKITNLHARVMQAAKFKLLHSFNLASTEHILSPVTRLQENEIYPGRPVQKSSSDIFHPHRRLLDGWSSSAFWNSPMAAMPPTKAMPSDARTNEPTRAGPFEMSS